MRSRPTALATSAIALSLLAAGCGKDDSTSDASNTPAATTAATATPTPAAVKGSSTKSGTKTTTPPGAPPVAKVKPGSVMATIKRDPELKTFAAALTSAGLAQTLSQPGPFTVFAPNDDAFTKLGTQLAQLMAPGKQNQLADVLKFQIVGGRLNTAKLKDGQLLTTLQGGRVRVTVSGSTVSLTNKVSTTTVLVPNMRATNGVVHVSDTVLMPRSK